MDCNTFDDETPRSRNCCELEPSARNRAISLSVKPTGTDVPGCGSGNAVYDVEDRW